jgi:hypothetical protein
VLQQESKRLSKQLQQQQQQQQQQQHAHPCTRQDADDYRGCLLVVLASD